MNHTKIKMILLILLLVLVAVGIFLLATKTAFFTYYLGKNDVSITKDIFYKEGSTNPQQDFDLYLPKETKNFPIVIFVHGGYWSSGDKSYHQGLTGVYGNIGVALAQKGIGAAIINYRLYPQVGIEDQISDVLASVKYVSDHSAEYGSNGDIFVMGHSAGGHLASFLAGSPDRLSAAGISASKIKGYIDFSGIWDIEDMVAKNDESFNKGLSFGLFGTTTAERAQYSPILKVQNFTAPIFVASGDPDFSYLKDEAKVADETLTSKKIPHDYFVAPGYQHTDMVVKFGMPNDPLLPAVLNFIKKSE